MTDKELTHQIIGAAIEVHRKLGPGLLESAYEECMCHELCIRRLAFERQKPVPVVYKETKLDCGYRLDLLVEGRVVVELKSIDGFGPIHEAVMLTYLRTANCRLGLLINFNVLILKDGLRRFILDVDQKRRAFSTERTETTENA